MLLQSWHKMDRYSLYDRQDEERIELNENDYIIVSYLFRTYMLVIHTETCRITVRAHVCQSSMV